MIASPLLVGDRQRRVGAAEGDRAGDRPSGGGRAGVPNPVAGAGRADHRSGRRCAGRTAHAQSDSGTRIQPQREAAGSGRSLAEDEAGRRDEDCGVRGRHGETRDSLGIGARGGGVVSGEHVVHRRRRVVSRGHGAGHPGHGSRRARRVQDGGIGHDQGARDRLIAGIQYPNGDRMAIGHVDGPCDSRSLERNDDSLDQRHGGSGLVRWRRATELQPVGASRGRREGEGSIRAGTGPVDCLWQCVRVAEKVQIRFERARMRSQNDLDVGGGSAASVDKGAGDGGRRVGDGLRLQRAGGEPGKPGQAEPQERSGRHVQWQRPCSAGHSGSLRCLHGSGSSGRSRPPAADRQDRRPVRCTPA